MKIVVVVKFFNFYINFYMWILIYGVVRVLFLFYFIDNEIKVGYWSWRGEVVCLWLKLKILGINFEEIWFKVCSDCCFFYNECFFLRREI